MSPAIRPAQRGAVLAIVLVIAAVAVVAALTVGTLSAMRVKETRRGWDRTLGSWDEMMQRYPATEANVAALELERLAALLGVNIAPRQYDDRVRPTGEQKQALAELKEAVFGIYLQPQLEQAIRGAIDTPPPVLTAYMADHDQQLANLRRHLIEGPVPEWESDLSRLWDAPLPNLLGHIALQKVLTSVALAHLNEGDVEGALESVEAAYRLSRSLHDSPVLISQLILIAGTRLQLGVLRHVPEVPQSLIERIEGHDYRRSFLTAMKYEGWVLLYSDPSAFSDTHDPWWIQTVVSPALRPYARLCLADVSDAWRERVVNLERVDALCDFDLASQGARMEIPIPRWNSIGDAFVLNMPGAVDRVARLELDLELTRLLFEADARRTADGGSWPTDLPAHRVSEACPNDRWVYTANDEGMRIDFSREIEWPGQLGPILPTRAVLN